VLIQATVTEPVRGAARLVCAVEDNGPGLQANPPRSGAFGLRAVRRRIELKYADGRLRLAASPEGTQAVVELPYVTAREPIMAAAAPEVAG
jgi:signal transduction histidine kinase